MVSAIKPSHLVNAGRRIKVKTLYDQLSENYEELYGQEQNEKHHRILEEIGSLQGRLVLDAGCGDGALAELVMGFAEFVIAMDFSAGMLATAKSSLSSNEKCDFILADIGSIPLRDESIGVYISVTVILDRPTADEAILEARRVLEKHGRLAISLVRKSHESIQVIKIIKEQLKGYHTRIIAAGADLAVIARL